jgi:peptidoglycan/LPS O-acetylase OafA/YrhL
MWVLELTAPQNALQWALLSLTSIGISALTQHYLERPSIIWRQKRRQAWQLAHKALKIQE